GLLDCGTAAITGTGAVILENNASINVRNVAGLDSQITTTGANDFGTAANFDFIGTAAMNTGTTLPASVGIFSARSTNSLTGLTLGASTTAQVLNLTAGELTTGSNSITAASINRTT